MVPFSRLRSLPDPLVQFVLVVGCVVLYFGVRGLTEGTVDRAVGHAQSLLEFERRFGLDLERSVQRPVLGNPLLLNVANWIYIWGHWPVLTGCALWLYRQRHHSYVRLRDALFVSGAIGLVIFALYPVAPPRLAGLGFVDTVTENSNAYRVLQPPHLINRYAALPSLHAGWNLAVGVAMYGAATSRVLRSAAIALPAAMSLAVVATANHFVIDAIAGAGLAMFGWWVAGRWPLRRLVMGRAERSQRAEQVIAIADEPTDAPTIQIGGHGEIVHPPGEHQLGAAAQLVDDTGLEQAPVDRHPVKIPRPIATQKAGQLRRTPH